MNLLKKYPNLLGMEHVEKVHLVPSKHHPETVYQVKEDKEGNLECECIAYIMSKQPKNCKHLDLIRLNKKNDISRI